MRGSNIPDMDQRCLRTVPGASTIYLIDEYHHCNPCTDENIRAAKELYTRGVVLAGVEGYEGGRKYDDYDDMYFDLAKHPDPRVDAECRPDTLIGCYPR